MGALGSSGSGELGAGIGGSYKNTSYRYQTYGRNERTGRVLVMTQDTDISYWQATGKLVAGLGVEGPTEGKEPKETGAFKDDEGKRVKEKEYALYNFISYRSAVAFWTPPTRVADEISVQQGSGYSLGRSLIAATLVMHAKAYAANKDKKAHKYLAGLAASLMVDLADVLAFVAACNNTLVSLYTRHGNKGQVVLVESCFAVPKAGGGEHKVAIKMQKPPHVPAIAHGKKGFRKPMFDAGGELQAMRLRIRKADTKDDTKVKFKLGVQDRGHRDRHRVADRGPGRQ